MIDRYSRKEIKKIWEEKNKYQIWLDIEIAAAQAMEKYKIIPKGVSAIVKRKGKIKVKRIHDIETKVKHDVIAFLTSITEQAGAKARYLHQGMTSSDVLDTSFNIQLIQSGKILINDIDKILSILKKRAKKLTFPKEIRDTIKFYGYNQYPLIALNEFRKMNNMVLKKLKHIKSPILIKF